MMLATNATTLSATSASRAFGNGRARSGALASSRGVVVASKTPSARLQRADWARTVAAVGNGVEPSRSGNARATRATASAAAPSEDPRWRYVTPCFLFPPRTRARVGRRATPTCARAPAPSRSIRTSLSIVRERVTRRARFSDASSKMMCPSVRAHRRRERARVRFRTTAVHRSDLLSYDEARAVRFRVRASLDHPLTPYPLLFLCSRKQDPDRKMFDEPREGLRRRVPGVAQETNPSRVSPAVRSA